MKITVEKFDEDGEEYPLVECEPSPLQHLAANVELDCRNKTLHAAPARDYYPDEVRCEYVRRYAVYDSLTAKEVNKLLDKIKPLAERVLDGFSVIRNAGWRKKYVFGLRSVPNPQYGHKFVGSLTYVAGIIEGRIQRLCERTFPRDEDD